MVYVQWNLLNSFVAALALEAIASPLPKQNLKT